MKKIAYILLVSALLMTGCGSSYRVVHDMDPEASFDQYKTFSFLDWTEGNKKTITGMELQRIRNNVASELNTKGLEFSEQDSDIKVKITVYFREAKDHYYGYYPGAYNYIERALAVDLFESATKKHIWHCAAIGEVERDPIKRAEELPEQVQEMFLDYPVN